MSKPKIGLVGYFGWGNFGDELFVEAHKEYLGNEYDLEIVHDKLEAPYFSDRRISELERFDGFLIGGGDLLNPSAVSQLYWRDEYLKKPVFVYGIGVPQPNRKSSPAINHYKKFFSHENVKAIVLRDIESMKYFNAYIQPRVEAVTFPDAVFAMTSPKAVKSDEMLIGIAIRDHRSVVGGYSEVRKAADIAKEYGYKVRIIVMANGVLGEGDLRVAKEFAREGEEVVYSENLVDICRAIGECHQLISMKFHGMVVASMYSVPSVQLSATPKNKNFLRYIQRLDLQSNYNSEELWTRVPRYPAPIHSILVRKLKRDSMAGYNYLLKCMREVYYS
jgi:polysaccharide pyruvyl transferase WcaK-like protein